MACVVIARKGLCSKPLLAMTTSQVSVGRYLYLLTLYAHFILKVNRRSCQSSQYSEVLVF